MKCENCSADLAKNAQYCSVCKKGKSEFIAVCPYCGDEMDIGKVKIQGTFGGFLLFGFSYQHLYYVDQNENENRIMKSRAQKEAYFCNNCEGIFIPSH
jgi:hypothetical protein